MEPLLHAPVIEGFGESTLAELNELRKALDIGYSQPVTGQGADALRVESLEATLKVLTYRAEHIRFWSMIPKLDASSTVEEFNRLVEYGSEGGAFLESGELPATEDTTYERADEKVKYVGSTREVNHPSTLVRTVPANVIAQETEAGALWIMGKVNRALYEGDADVIPTEWNGVIKQAESGSAEIVDMRGAPLSKESLENGAQLVADNFGMANQMFANGRVFTDFSKLYYENERIQLPAGATVGGSVLTGYQTINGKVAFQPDTFARRSYAPPASATSAKAPTAPTIGTFTTPADAASQFATADVGDYRYKVSAINKFGESVPSASSGAITVAAGDKVTWTITDGGGSFPATGYKVYRSEKDVTTSWNLIQKIARSKTGSSYDATTTANDYNADLPLTFKALLVELQDQIVSFKQLLPMVKMDLAIVSPAIRWMQLLYGTPIVYAPKKMVVYKNIGVAA